MKVRLLYSGGHVHLLETHKDDLVSDLIIAKRKGTIVYPLFDEDGEHEIGMIDVQQLQMAWVVFED